MHGGTLQAKMLCKLQRGGLFSTDLASEGTACLVLGGEDGGLLGILDRRLGAVENLDTV